MAGIEQVVDMRMAQLVLVVLCFLVATGCGEAILPCSERPLYSDDVLAAEPDLEGTWTQQWTHDKAFGKLPPRTQITVSLKKREDGVYDLVYQEGDNRITGAARLVCLGEQLYLDVEVHDVQGPLRVAIDSWLGPILRRGLHWPCRIAVKGESLGVAGLRPDWYARMAETGGGSLQVIVLKDDVKAKVMGGSTRQLQELFREHGDDLFDTTRSVAVYRRQATKADE